MFIINEPSWKGWGFGDVWGISISKYFLHNLIGHVLRKMKMRSPNIDFVEKYYSLVISYQNRNVSYQYGIPRIHSEHHNYNHDVKLVELLKLIADRLSWNWQCNDIIMMWQNGFVFEITKKCDIQQHFWFCHKWVMWQRCVICPWHMIDDLAFYSSIFVMFPNFLFPSENTYHDAVLWGLMRSEEVSPKKCHHYCNGKVAMAMDSVALCGSNFSCNGQFWWSQLHQWVFSLQSKNDGLFFLFPGVERQLFSWL